MPYPPAAAASPSPTIVRADTSPAWWEILLDVLVALGTVGAVVAALLVANWARKDADRRALADRKAFAERQEEEREHDRRLADTRWRLSLLEQLIEAFERWQALDQMQLPGGETRGTVEALARGYPGDLPVLKAWFVQRIPLDDIHATAEQYGPQDFSSVPDLARLELRHKLEQVRQELLRGHR
jgi:hypothetical protein